MVSLIIRFADNGVFAESLLKARHLFFACKFRFICFSSNGRGEYMAYLIPSEFVTKMVDAGESRIFMSTRDTVIRAYMAGAILALAAVFAITMTVQTGSPLIGALLFPVGFCMLYLMGFDLLTGVFVLAPLAWLDKRKGVTFGGVLRKWKLLLQTSW